MRYMFETLADLREHKFTGNFQTDRTALRAADRFILRSTDRDEQLAAYNIIIANALGEANHPLHMSDLDAALAETREFLDEEDEKLADIIAEFCDA